MSTNYYLLDNPPSKRAIIDWLSFTFVLKEQDIYINLIVQELLKIFGFKKHETKIERKAVNGFSKSLLIGEHIKIMFDSPVIKNSEGEPIAQLLMSGQACREFELNIGGNWNHLLSFLVSRGNFKRIDLAIDDFKAEEINIYDLEDIIVKKANYVSCFKDIDYRIQFQRNSKEVDSIQTLKTYWIRLGTEGKNNLLIYDKLLERKARDQLDYDVNIWNRYEMRIVDDKANELVRKYVLYFENKENNFLDFVSGVLINYLDLKKPSKDLNKSRWRRLPEWSKFLNSIQKIDLKARLKQHSTIDTLIAWSNKSLAKVSAQQVLTQGGLYYEKLWKEGVKRIVNENDTKTLSKINNDLEAKGYATYTMLDLERFLDKQEQEESINLDYED